MTRGRPRRRHRGERTPLLPRDRKARRRVELLGGAACLLFAAATVGVFLLPTLQQFALRSAHVSAVISSVLVELVNSDRAAHGLGALQRSEALDRIARAKAEDMAHKGYFAHTSPEGKDSWYWFAEGGYEFVHAGENLAVDFADSGDVEKAWMESPSHRENILDGTYTEIGIATARGTYQGRETTFVVQVFGTPRSARAGAPAAPTLVSAEPVPDLARGTGSQVLGTSSDDGRTETSVEAADVPFWAYALALPRDTLRYLYYALALLVLFALAADTGLEFGRHHAKRAWRAGFLLATMATLFLLADHLFFAEPALAVARHAL